MRLVCQEGLLPGADRREKCHNGRAYGFDGIEISGRGLKANLKEYQELSHEFGLPVTSIGLGWDGAGRDRHVGIGACGMVQSIDRGNDIRTGEVIRGV